MEDPIKKQIKNASRLYLQITSTFCKLIEELNDVAQITKPFGRELKWIKPDCVTLKRLKNPKAT